MAVADYSGGRPGGAALGRAGFTGAVRYLSASPANPYKRIDRAELNDLAAAGIAVAGVWETTAGWLLGGADVGATAGAMAGDWAAVLGLPATFAVYAAADFDVQPKQLSVVDETVRAFAAALHPYRAGAYGPRGWVAGVLAARAVALGWSAAGWAHGQAPAGSLVQRVQTVTVNGVACDVNDVLHPDWGQYPQPPAPPAPDEPEVDDMALLRIYTDEHDGKEWLVNLDAYTGAYIGDPKVAADLRAKLGPPVPVSHGFIVSLHNVAAG